QTDRKAGAGLNGATSGQLPPAGNAAGATSSASPNDVGTSFALGSIAAFMPGGKYSDPAIVCTLALQATNNVADQNCLQQVESLNREREQAADSEQAQAKQAIDELAKSHDNDGWGTFFKDLPLAVGAVLAVSGVGTVAGGIIIGLVIANDLSEAA